MRQSITGMRTEADPPNQGRVLALTVPPDLGARRRRQKMLDAMADAVAEKTFPAVTIADVVGRAGVSRATFYKHFENKRACFEAAVDRLAEELVEAARGAHVESDPAPEAIRAVAAAVLGVLAAKPAYAKLVLIEAISVNPAIVDRYRRLLVEALTERWPAAELPERAGAEARAAYGRAQVLVCTQIVAGRAEHLQELLPDIVYIALLPFVSPEEALRQAQLAG